jgi:hypothetical protein
VRKTNSRGQRLYERVGFRRTGSCTKDICGIEVDFDCMEITRETFLAGLSVNAVLELSGE